MHRTVFLVLLVMLVMAPSLAGAAAGDGDLRILTYPIGLVTGEQVFEFDLGARRMPVDLYLDGEKACTATAAEPRCTVDLGEAPHIHLLELVRRDGGRVVARTSRWVNRPGQEAELAIQLAARSPQGVCGGKALWSHPLKKDPVLLEITENGRNLRIREDGRSFAFPCPDAEEPHVLAASAIFADGRRAEAVALSGGFGGSTEAGLTAMALSVADTGVAVCEQVARELGDDVKVAAGAGFEVVFVLDPTAGYRTLMASGWSKGMMPTTTNSTKQFDSLVQQGSKGSDARPKNSWKRAESSLIDAEKMWFVLPDEKLQRANGFAQGKMNWLMLLFHFGSVKLDHTPHLANAVATSGLVAAAGPRRRAVVLVLGNKAERDDSTFTAEQAQTYLAEVGVPLYVLRSGKLREDGWPAGVPIKTMESVADSLETVKNDLDRQCVTWFPGQMSPSQIMAMLPDGVDIAGRRGAAQADGDTVWQRAELDEVGAEPMDITVAGTAGEPVARARVEVTAVTVLFAARDAGGDPITDLNAEEIEVSEDGELVNVLGLTRMPRTGGAADNSLTPIVTEGEAEEIQSIGAVPVSIYVDRRLSGSKEISSAIGALADRSEWLVSLGPVDVVLAENEVSAVLEGSEDSEEIRGALALLAAQPGGRHAIEQIRTRFLRDIREYPNRLTRQDMGIEEDTMAGDPARAPGIAEGQEDPKFERSKVLTAARSAIFEEDGLLRQSMGRVSDWALTWPSGRPRMLLVVGAGFDEDPVDFYLPFVERMETQSTARAREDFRRFRQAPRVDQVGQDLAAAGWLVVPVASRTTGSQTGAAEIGGGDRFQMFMSAQPDAIRTSYAEFLLLDPLGAQRHLAAPSGGEVAMGGDGLDRLIESSSGWYQLSYQIDRPPDGANHQLAIASTRPDVDIRSTSVIASETLEGEAAARVRRLLNGGSDVGEMVVEIDLSQPERAAEKQMAAEATITMRLDAISPLLVEGSWRNLRVSVGVLAGDEEAFILHRMETVDGVVDSWGYRVPLRWPAGPARLAVVVEDLGTGAWGGVTQDLR